MAVNSVISCSPVHASEYTGSPTSYWGLEELKGPGVEGVATGTFTFRDSESRGEGGTSSLVASGDCPRYCDVCECGTSPVEDGVREGWVLSYLFGLCPCRSVDGFERVFPSPSSPLPLPFIFFLIIHFPHDFFIHILMTHPPC